MNKDPRIIFMGTPDFAVASLNALVEAGCNIVGVVTAPDKPAGRGMKLTASAVKDYASEKGLNILQPEKLKSPSFLNDLQDLKADLQIVVAFRMLPEVVWNMPPLGTINLHGSLLPQYRGAAPINWAIINGEKETGVTTFKLQHEIDTGNILLQEKIAIDDNEIASELHDRMKVIGASLVVKTVNGFVEGSLQEISQGELLSRHPEPTNIHIKHAPKIFTDTCRIDWSRPVNDIYNRIRGLSYYPGAFTTLDNKTFKIFRATKEHDSVQAPPGEHDTDKKSYLRFAANDGYISVKELQIEGKRRMTVEEFLRGWR